MRFAPRRRRRFSCLHSKSRTRGRAPRRCARVFPPPEERAVQSKVRSLVCQLQQPVQLQRLFCLLRQTLHFFLEMVDLLRGYKPKVGGFRCSQGAPADSRRRQCRSASPLARERRVAYGGAAVENHAADAAFRLKAQEAFDACQYGQRRAACVHDQNGRALRLLRKLKGACACRGQPQPVIVAHDAFR